jgi:hypothetical protein
MNLRNVLFVIFKDEKTKWRCPKIFINVGISTFHLFKRPSPSFWIFFTKSGSTAITMKIELPLSTKMLKNSPFCHIYEIVVKMSINQVTQRCFVNFRCEKMVVITD